MKATIKTYQGNADLFLDGQCYGIRWDGAAFDTRQEYDEWIDEQLAPIAGAENLADIRTTLEIATDSLRPEEAKAIVLDEQGRWADCPNEAICMNDCNPSCPQYPAKVGTSLVGSLKVVRKLSQDMAPEEVLRIWKAGQLWVRTDALRKCINCDKEITSGYVWDGELTFCSEECIDHVFGDCIGTASILMDRGRVVWHDHF